MARKFKKVEGGHGHHGGAWKVAYADFVTAMMAFFMVMWLVASVNKETRAAIFDYFKNPSMDQGKSPKAAMTILSEMGNRLRETNALLSQRASTDANKEFEESLSWSQKLADKVVVRHIETTTSAAPAPAPVAPVVIEKKTTTTTTSGNQ